MTVPLGVAAAGLTPTPQLELSGSSHGVANAMTTIRDVRSDLSGKRLEVTWESVDQPAAFPFVWLRDCCQCPQCFHPVSNGRLLLLRDVSLDVTPDVVEVIMSPGSPPPVICGKNVDRLL